MVRYICKDIEDMVKKKYVINKSSEMCNKELQYVFSGGGFCGFYGVGIGHIVNNYMDKTKIRGLIGSSAGALNVVFIACGISAVDWYETFHILLRAVAKGKSMVEAINISNDEKLPINAHEICNKYNVEIVCSKITPFGLKRVVFSHFSSREELLLCMKASCCIPYVLEWKYPYCVKIGDSYYIDGGLVDNTPIKKNCKYDQVVVKVYNLSYPIRHRFGPSDTKVHRIMIQGAEDFVSVINDSSNINKKVFKIVKANTVAKRRQNVFLYNASVQLVIYFILNTFSSRQIGSTSSSN